MTKDQSPEPSKTIWTIDEFERWMTPRVADGKLLRDVIAAYIETYPGRTVRLILDLYCRCTDLEEEIDERDES